MTTHKTIETAREAAKTNQNANCIIEIEHASEGRCFIVCAAPLQTLAAALARKPMAEIRRLLAQHSLLTEAEIASARENALRDHTKCERCNKKIDGNTAYSQQEWFQRSRVTAYYCDSCHAVLSGIGAGEHTELQERASARHGYEPSTKEDC